MQSNQTTDLDFKTKGFCLDQHPSLHASTNFSNNRGLMDVQAIGSLSNSISRFIHLVSCRTMITMPVQKNYKTIVSLLKHLKSLLDEVVNLEIPSDELLHKEFEELDMVVNKAREFVEKWCPKMSKICCVLQSDPLLEKVKISSLEICRRLSGLLQSSSTSHLACIQRCMQEIQCAELERTSELIEEALSDQGHGFIPQTEHLLRIKEFLNLTSNREMLRESIALEWERGKAKVKESKEDIYDIAQIIDLAVHIRDCLFKHEQFAVINGILIPSYFRCPLSLEMMLDPVIVASGQTYERAFIQKWLDQGLKVCPKTHQILIHTNLIPNYTVKALIANWCEVNNIRLAVSADYTEISSHSVSHGVPEDIIHVDSFHSSSHSGSTSHSFIDVGTLSERQRIVGISTRNVEKESNSVVHCETLTDKVSSKCCPSHEQSYCHSRSDSVSSVISSINCLSPATLAAAVTEVSRISSEYNDKGQVSGEVISECPYSSLSKDLGCYPWLSGSQYNNSDSGMLSGTGNVTNHQNPSSPFIDSICDDLTTYSHVQKLVDDLRCQSCELQTSATSELRLLAKHNMENRIIIAKCGAITPLVSLLYSKVKLTQENAVTALLNLSINDRNKAVIAEAGAIEPLIHVLKSGSTEAKENSAATLFSLSALEEYKIKIGRSGAVKALVDLLGSGSLRGRKDAATALFNLSIFHENKARIVQAGAVKYLIELMDPSRGMADKAIALLANLATIPEGCMAITQEGGIPSLVEAVEIGSQRGKENAASALFQLCINNSKFCRLVLQEGAVPPLVALSQSGTPRAKEKAQQILSHFRSQRDGGIVLVKSR